jgi:GT2 family glycosyltransferase
MTGLSHPQANAVRVAVVVASYNRKSTTLRCLASLPELARQAGASVATYLFDDASPDGTASAVKEIFPTTTVLSGDGNQHYTRSMHAALSRAKRGDYDYYWLINDDVVFDDDALVRLLNAHLDVPLGHAGNLVAGALREPETGATTYGGAIRVSTRKPLTFAAVQPDTAIAKPCDAAYGNCMLLCRAAVSAVGNFDPKFLHALGDFDLGLRAKAAGTGVWLAAGHLGDCRMARKAAQRVREDGSVLDRWRFMVSPFGYPVPQYTHFARRHGGPLWPVYVPIPYLATLTPRWLRMLVNYFRTNPQLDKKTAANK